MDKSSGIFMRCWIIVAGTLLAGCLTSEATTTEPQPGAAQANSAPFAQSCAKVTCRSTIRNLQLSTVEGDPFSIPTTLSPYVDENGVASIYAGEAIEISFDRNDPAHPKFSRVIDHVSLDGLKGYHADAPPPSPSTPAILSLEFQQNVGAPGMRLLLRNDTGIALKYDATMVVATRDGIKSKHTSMCPILPGMMGDENWPHPVIMLLLSNFRKADGASFDCS